MKIYKLPECEEVDEIPYGASVALGNFDGVHKGHKALFDSCNGIKVVWTFKNLAKPGFEVPYLTSINARLRLFAEFGMDYAIFEDFDHVRSLSPEEFVHDYLSKLVRPKKVICGFNFRFGYRGMGDAEQLSNLLKKDGIECEIKSPVFIHNHIVSSSYIRELVLNGKMKEAEEFLGHPFSIEFPVVKGNQLGRTIGIPTINQEFPKGHIIPMAGIYACTVMIGNEPFLGVANIGTRPTVSNEGRINCETHIIDYSGILYDKEIRVDFYRKIRDEKKFSSIKELKEQIEKDIKETMRVFAELYGA